MFGLALRRGRDLGEIAELPETVFYAWLGFLEYLRRHDDERRE
jgi:hypothetical protein